MNKQLSILLFTWLVLLSVCDNSTEPKDCAGESGGDAFIIPQNQRIVPV